MQAFKRIVFLLSIVLLFGTSSHTFAQQISLSSSDTEQAGYELNLIDNPEAVRALVSRLSDNEVRDLLLQQLDAVASKQAAEEITEKTDFFTLITTNIPISIQAAVSAFPTMISGQAAIFSTFVDSLGPNGVLKLLGGILLAIAIGLIVEFLVRKLTRKWRSKIDSSSSINPSLKDILALLSLRFVLDLSGLLAFIVVTQIVLRQVIDPKAGFFMHHFLWNLVLIPRLFSVVLKFALAPKRSDLRLIHTSDEAAQFLHKHLVCVALLIGFTLSVMDLRVHTGILETGTRIGFWFNLIIHLYFAFIAWQSRFTLIDIINGKDDDATSMEKTVAKLYPYYAMLVIVSSWTLVEVLVAQNLLHLVTQGVQYSTMFILLLAPVLDTAIRGLVKHLTPAIVGEGSLAQQAYESSKRSYIRIGRLLVMLFVITWLTRIWGIDIANLDASDIGTTTTRKFVEFIGIFAVGYFLWEVTTLWLNRKLAAEKTVAGGDGESALPGGDEGGAGGSRLSTVLPLITWFLQTTILIMTLLIGLGSVGIDTTPLLAGAGIVGLAIGFGAQKLVTDIVSGLFFLIDDAFRAGEYVNVEGTMGTVEKISLRAMQLRHHRGPIHTIPYGEIPKITNYSRDWAIMKLTFTVPFETDLIKVKKIFKTIGNELMEMPEFAGDFIQPFKSQGVIQVDDIGIVIRGKFMVKPGKQFQIRKEIFQRVQSEFEKNGIQFARKEVRVKLDSSAPTEKQLSESQKSAIGAAALEASEIKPAT
ncbi:mechanosensitive ion channel family protein [Granulosicoccus antarcticus]|uniref:Moderate conductance mechanosensitive channel YbiO n=1 Tax=Granulosicoccus antarcticus IMCC3135 TaxID=1192854 RepID=A0A2Z2NIR5_9GAMM|nr:mechanosensitive ion channel family protein [Granulosicoccus antarcticus]ASJ71242.1 Moderate conductance mechanosensitive channel YbiO [Granulosicoccus antarcticus IMCC3135]